jgi:hypothetical protein
LRLLQIVLGQPYWHEISRSTIDPDPSRRQHRFAAWRWLGWQV